MVFAEVNSEFRVITGQRATCKLIISTTTTCNPGSCKGIKPSYLIEGGYSSLQTFPPALHQLTRQDFIHRGWMSPENLGKKSSLINCVSVRKSSLINHVIVCPGKVGRIQFYRMDCTDIWKSGKNPVL